MHDIIRHEQRVGRSIDDALQMLAEIPSFVQQMVAEMVEDLVTKEGSDTVTHERLMQLMKEYAPSEVLERFEDK